MSSSSKQIADQICAASHSARTDFAGFPDGKLAVKACIISALASMDWPTLSIAAFESCSAADDSALMRFVVMWMVMKELAVVGSKHYLNWTGLHKMFVQSALSLMRSQAYKSFMSRWHKFIADQKIQDPVQFAYDAFSWTDADTDEVVSVARKTMTKANA